MRRFSSIARVCAAAILAVVIATPAVHADEPATVGDETIIVVDRPRGGPRDLTGADPGARDRGRALGDAPFVSIVHPDDHAGELASLAEVLGHLVGTQLDSLGGLGGYAALSVRGAPPGHTAVLVDGVPLSRIASVTADLGRFELDGLDEVALYRGAVPVGLGGAGVGGALELTTRLGRGARGERILVSTGTGSFGARHLRVRAGDDLAGGRLRGVVTAGYTGADGDYRYFSDNGTALTPTDDAWLDRTNNGFDQLDLAARLGGTGAAQPVGGLRATWRDQGLPGSATAPTMTAALETTAIVGDAAISTTTGAATARHRGYGIVEWQRYRDLDGEVGLGVQDRRYVSGSGGAVTSWAVPLGRHRLTAAADARADVFRDHDELADRPRVTGDREGGGLAIAADLALGAVVLVPAVRVDTTRTAPAIDRDEPPDPDAGRTRWDTVVSPRLTARWLAAADLAVKASAGRYARLPTVVELFGDRGFLLGAPELRPETGSSADAGVVWAPPAPLAGGHLDRILVEAAAFASRPHDAIVFETTVGGVARARNTGDARVRGLELAAAVRVDRALGLAASYTLTDAVAATADVNLDGKRLPRQPRHAAYARADFATRVEGRLAVVWTDVEWRSTTYLDRSNLYAVPGRALAGAGVKAELGGGVLVGFEVKNLTDAKLVRRALDPAPRPDLASVPAALSDVAGFPLPGRAFYVTAEWTR
jgi:iron complex outermembrane receptor protein